ncbi:MAG: thioredoxin [Lysobacterales bacterium CG02_land_8_20_14_3_00_62_12]|nr:MAG: thioredoxin [Xanthomonadales bacterium CG02_land_8_20_14_3_00_62_12]
MNLRVVFYFGWLLGLGLAASVQADSQLPKLDLATVDGGKFVLAEQRGKWVVVNYWATWCPPCLKEMPELGALDRDREDLVVVGLAFEEIALADMQAFLKERAVSYPIAIVDVYHPPADFSVPRGLPQTYLIAPDGQIAEKILGPVTRAELEHLIQRKSKPKG